jgi:hypothetical protein
MEPTATGNKPHVKRRNIMASKTKTVTASVVREWAKGIDLSKVEGLPENYSIGTRGRLHPAIRAEFAKKNKGVRYDVGYSEPKSVKVKTFMTNAKGGKTPLSKTVIVSEVRKAAQEAGVPVGERGMPQRAVLEAFARGDLKSLVPSA